MLAQKIAFCTGITGQDGSYLAEKLLEQGYKVHGLIRRNSLPNTTRISHIIEKIELETADLLEGAEIAKIISRLQPDEIYNLAAQSDVKISFQTPESTSLTNTIGILHILEAVRNFSPHTRVYQASTSELYGGQNVPPNGYNEESPFRPRSPYAISKLYAYWTIKMYREAYGVFASNGILFNHESPRRGENFVTKKITSWCGKYWKYLHQKSPFPNTLKLGNLQSSRDWGHAQDYVDAMVLINQHTEPDDWVVATEKNYTVREFVERCFAWMNVQLKWQNKSLDEIGIAHNRKVIEISKDYFRPNEVNNLKGNSSKIKNKLGWKPKFDFDDLVDDMMRNEIR